MQASGGGRGVYITPSHHYPLGYSLSLDRRLALLQWAQRQRAWIIEDDYDAEFNYDRQTKAALQGLDGGGRTLYLGTFSKTLFPGLRIGFMIAPPQLVRPLVAARQFQDGYTSALAQMTLFHFLHEGGYAEHLRNMRTLYKARLDVLYDAVHRHLAAWTRPALPQGGLQLVCPLADAATGGGWWRRRPSGEFGCTAWRTSTPACRSAGRWCSASRPIRRMRSCALSPRWRRCSARCRWKATVKIGLLCVLNWSVLHCLRAVYSAAIRLFPNGNNILLREAL